MPKIIEWQTDPIPYKDFKDGQRIIACFSSTEIGLYEWDKEDQDFYDAYEGGDTFTPEEFNKIGIQAWAYFEYPGKEAE